MHIIITIIIMHFHLSCNFARSWPLSLSHPHSNGFSNCHNHYSPLAVVVVLLLLLWGSLLVLLLLPLWGDYYGKETKRLLILTTPIISGDLLLLVRITEALPGHCPVTGPRCQGVKSPFDGFTTSNVRDLMSFNIRPPLSG